MDRFLEALAAFDDYHRRDPNRESIDGTAVPGELLYAQRMTQRLTSFAQDASEIVQLAARCQHIGRWEIPRSKYPMDRKGYLQWRNEEKMHHARIAEDILRRTGYDDTVIDQVKTLLLKKELSSNTGSQLLEDVACLVFLEHYAKDFALRHDDDKVVDILRKTLRKMSSRAKEEAMSINLPAAVKDLLLRATTAA